MSQEYNTSQQVGDSLDKAKNATGAVGKRVGRKVLKKAVGKGVLAKVAAAANLKVLGIVFLCFLVALPLLLVTDSTNLTMILPHTDEGGKTTDIDPASDYSDQDIITEDTKYAQIIIDAMMEDYEYLDEAIKEHCDEEGVDYDGSIVNVADNTVVPYLKNMGMGDSTIRVVMLDSDDSQDGVIDKLKEFGVDEAVIVHNINDVDENKYDALVIPGGYNVSPELYGEPRSEFTSDTDLDKDKMQIAAVRKFAAKKKPILGVCRGCQLINVAFGGTIDQGDGVYHRGDQTITVKKGSWLYDELGDTATTYHYHKQQVKDVAPGFEATMWSNKDGKTIIEAIEHKELPIWCLQWHPEAGDEAGDAAFKAFIEEIRKRKPMISKSGYKAKTPAIQGAIEWACAVANDDTFNYGTYGPANDIGCYLCGTNQQNKPEGFEKTYVCLTFVGAAYAHGAQDPEILKADQDGRMPLYENDSNFSRFSCWKKVGRACDLNFSDMEPGDVMIDWSDENGMDGHANMYLGGDDLVESSGGGWSSDSIGIKKGEAKDWFSYLQGDSSNYIMRYVGSGPGPVNAEIFGVGKIAGLSAGSVSSGGTNNVAENACKWAEKIANEGKYHYVHFDSGPAAEKCPICDNHSPNGAYYGWNCIGFVTAAYFHGGNLTSIECSNEGLGNDALWDAVLSDSTNEEALQRWKSRNGDNWEIIRKGGQPLSDSDLQRGDVVVEYDGTRSTHVLLYVGDGKVSDCTSVPNKIHYGRSHEGDDPIKVAFRYTGSGGSYKAYDEITTLETFSESTGTVKELPAGGAYAYQSFAYNDGDLYFMQPRRGARGDGGNVHHTNKDLQSLNESYGQPIRHANGVTYDTTRNKLYSATTASVGNNRVLCEIDPRTLKVTGEMDIPNQAHAVAFDKVTKRYILSSGASSSSDTAYLHVYDSNLSQESGAKTIKKMRWSIPCDIAAHNGVIYVGVSDVPSGGHNNYIDMYNEENGDYLGSYECPYKELEGIDIDDTGEIILLFHGNPPIVQFTGKIFENSAGIGGQYNLEEAVATRDIAGVISAFSVYESQKLPVLDLGEDLSPLKLLLYKVKSELIRDKHPEKTLESVLRASAGQSQKTNGKPTIRFFNIIYAEPVDSGGKQIYPLIEVNPATSEQLARLFNMTPTAEYKTEFGSSEGDRQSGTPYTVGDTNVAEAIETNTDSHLELLFNSLRGKLPPDLGPLVLPIKNMISSIPLTKKFSQDKKGIECEPGKIQSVHACERGYVNKVVLNDKNLGTYIEISGKYKIIYAHLDIAIAQKGQMVSQNDVIATCSSKFRLEVYEEENPIDPEPLFIKKTGLAGKDGGKGGKGNMDIVEVAAKEVGATSGDKYREWYTGHADGAAWCATFVSWCADQCGFIESGIIPKFAYVPNGVDWFKSHGQWQDSTYTPNPGDIIFFNWDGGLADHVGIVESVDGNVIHTIEGNTSGGVCARRNRTVSDGIIGYGCPAYPSSGGGESGIVDGRRTSPPEEGNKYYSPPANKFDRNWSTGGGNCTWYAWGRFMEYHGSTDIPLAFPSWGRAHAVMFYENTNYDKGQTPKPGSLAVWGYNGSKTGTPGHVAFVEEVKSNGDIECTESGWSGGLFKESSYTAASGYKYNWANAVFVGFIYPKVDKAQTGGGGGKNEYQNYASSQLSSHGWSQSELDPLIKLWDKESGWNPRAENSSSGAYGIPQALPGSKMSSEGDDWKTNYKTQIRWGLNYIESRYGSPSNAWNFFCTNNWY